MSEVETMQSNLEPLAEIPISPEVAALPKADLHLHQEVWPRRERLAARREGRVPFDWAGHARRVMAETPAGHERLVGIYQPDRHLDVRAAPEGDPEVLIARIAEQLEEGAADGAVLLEIRFGSSDIDTYPDFMTLFREAERRVQRRFPRLRAEAIAYLNLGPDEAVLRLAERRLEACLAAAAQGLGGVDFRVDPYDQEPDPALWAIAYRDAERAAGAGLGITVHAAEFSPAALAVALEVPHLKRIGHGVHAAGEGRFMDTLVRYGVTVECCLTSNVVLGAVPSYEEHPIKRLVEAGVPTTLNTDLPVHACTSIGREYAVAAALRFSTRELLEFTRHAVRASFTGAERRRALLDELDHGAADRPASPGAR
ncbi:MAG TPA: hypothetical protein VHS99_04280 [Chloroflexota bacterium]|nr:hypothetical protein [Chloroflexota bacterium]